MEFSIDKDCGKEWRTTCGEKRRSRKLWKERQPIINRLRRKGIEWRGKILTKDSHNSLASNEISLSKSMGNISFKNSTIAGVRQIFSAVNDSFPINMNSITCCRLDKLLRHWSSDPKQADKVVMTSTMWAPENTRKISTNILLPAYLPTELAITRLGSCTANIDRPWFETAKFLRLEMLQCQPEK